MTGRQTWDQPEEREGARGTERAARAPTKAALELLSNDQSGRQRHFKKHFCLTLAAAYILSPVLLCAGNEVHLF